MMVRLLRPWKFKKVGQIMADFPDGAANMLIKRGIAEQVKPEPVAVQPKKEKAARVRA